jgi:hypothetical protein
LLLSLRPVRPKTIRIRPPSEYPGRRLAHVRAPSPGPGSRTQSGLRLFRGRREKFAKNFARQGSLRGQRALGAVRCMQRAVAFRGDAETCLDPGLRRDGVGFGASGGDANRGPGDVERSHSLCRGEAHFENNARSVRCDACSVLWPSEAMRKRVWIPACAGMTLDLERARGDTSDRRETRTHSPPSGLRLGDAEFHWTAAVQVCVRARDVCAEACRGWPPARP